MSETTVRLLVFFGIFAAMALWEIAAPRRALAAGRSGRWVTNWGISILNAVVTAGLKIGLGAAAVLAAMDAAAHGIGLFHHVTWIYGWRC